MAAQVSLIKSVGAVVQPKQTATGRSAKQVAASKKWAAAGRKAQKGKAKSAKQIAAAKRNLAKGRAVVAARRAQTQRRATAPDLENVLSPLHLQPVCAAVAISEHLFAATGLVLTDAEVLSLADAAGSCPIGDMLELVYSTGSGFGPGARLAAFHRCDEDLIVPGLVCGLILPGNGLYHAVLSHSGGMLSWSIVQPWLAAPEEAWYLEWELA